MHLERDEMAVLLAFVCGFVGGCYSGFAMFKSRRQGFVSLGLTVLAGVFVWLVYQIDIFRERPSGSSNQAIHGIGALLVYALIMGVGVLLPGVVGCCLVWLILYLTALCKRRRG
jgi:hypothetical protein